MDFMSASPDAADLASASSCGMMSEDFRFVVVAIGSILVDHKCAEIGNILGELTALRVDTKLLKLSCRGSSLVERRPEKAGVASSILAPGTIHAATPQANPRFRKLCTRGLQASV